MRQEEKNNIIKEHASATRKKRESQVCKTLRFKVDKSNLNKDQKEALCMLFVEAKWLYNFLLDLSQKDPSFDITDARNYKMLRHITHKDKDMNDIEVDLNYLGSSLIQGVIDKTKFAIRGLAKLKEKGHKIGKLKFKKKYESLFFKQYKVTHRMVTKNRIKLQGVPGNIRLLGTKQMYKYKNYDMTTMTLDNDGYDWYVNLTVYIDKKEIKRQTKYNNDIIGVDFGCTHTLTLSDGTKFDCKVEETDKLKKLEKKRSNQQKMSNNYKKTSSQISKEWTHIKQKKKDMANKAVHYLTTNYETVVTQDDDLREWHKKEGNNANTSKTVQHSCLGRIKSGLKEKQNVVFLNKWIATSKLCTNCMTIHKKLELSDRTFVCPNCGHVEDRDVHAANNMIYLYQHNIHTGKELASALSWPFGGTKESTTSSALC